MKVRAIGIKDKRREEKIGEQWHSDFSISFNKYKALFIGSENDIQES